jgi:hypothetical protein
MVRSRVAESAGAITAAHDAALRDAPLGSRIFATMKTRCCSAIRLSRRMPVSLKREVHLKRLVFREHQALRSDGA